jgi:hypothetical protein
MLNIADFSEAQQAAIDALYSGNKLLIASKGFGKCAVGQTAIQCLQDDGYLGAVLVLAPLKVCELTWACEWEKWQHLRPPIMAIGDERTRHMAIGDAVLAIANGETPIVVMNFENVAWYCEHYRVHKSTGFNFTGLLVDESTKLKAAGGEAFKALRNELRYFSWRCAMTADPVAEIGVDIYTQAMIVDNGDALGRNLEAFRRKYFYPTDFQQRKWSVLPGMDKALGDVLQDVLYVVRDDSYEASLPELVDKVVFAEMPADAWHVYYALESDGGHNIMAGERAHLVIADTAALVTAKQQQVTAGAVYDSLANPKDRKAHWLHTAKLAALFKIVQAARGPLAIAYKYTFELDFLREIWPDIAVLGENPKVVEDAWNAGAVRLMALHPSSCSHGLNLQYGGCDLVVLSMPWGADPWEQLIGRFRRRGQPSAVVTRTVICVADSIDMKILARHKQKAYDSETLNDALAGDE